MQDHLVNFVWPGARRRSRLKHAALDLGEGVLAALDLGEGVLAAGAAGGPIFWDPSMNRKGQEKGGGVRSGPGSPWSILLFHIISARPSKQPLIIRTFLKVYMELGSYVLFLQDSQ